jgi:hypothetical protein
MNITLLNNHWVIEDIRKEINKFLESNENLDTSYLNLCDTEKVVLRGMCIAMSPHIRKLRKISDK